jgi:predicted RNase H-like HicB family nuclease
MLASYLDSAMEQAVYEIIEDEGTHWGEVPGLQGVWARHATLTGCQRELREALSDWVALRLRLGLPIPVLAGIDFNHIAQPTVPKLPRPAPMNLGP